MKNPKLFLVSAPSGAGKSSLIDAVLASAKQSDLALELSISYTTRSPRKGESNGNQYFFISEEDFIDKKNSNFFLEYAKVHGNWYGTSVDFVESKLSSGINLILEIDVQGFRQINELDIKYESIFILPPSIYSLEERIKSRGDEDIESINLRLKNAKDELAYAKEYKHIIINDSFEDAEKELFNIIAQENSANKQNIEEVQQFLAQLLSY
ncbi:MAG: guanylate kinase [SAR86 cluster bacterium]|jgi:guanylate kinase|nr:guanylate kinase [Gammaproteobacteria bacterium]MDB3950324.1 guanylate kinase [Gammaproteobacteria bacterium]MDC3228094.1 guanylate kinase [Gammaproteobacteria bacterium]MDG1961314.1 guanylate kinase [SAR86 cluster bacterium]